MIKFESIIYNTYLFLRSRVGLKHVRPPWIFLGLSVDADRSTYLGRFFLRFLSIRIRWHPWNIIIWCWWYLTFIQMAHSGSALETGNNVWGIPLHLSPIQHTTDAYHPKWILSQRESVGASVVKFAQHHLIIFFNSSWFDLCIFFLLSIKLFSTVFMTVEPSLATRWLIVFPTLVIIEISTFFSPLSNDF